MANENLNLYSDCLVVDGDFVFTDEGNVITIDERQSIGQDLKHRLIETGYVLLLLGQRSDIERQTLINKILIEVDKDNRIEPGTAQVFTDDNNTGKFVLTARTIDFGDVQVII